MNRDDEDHRRPNQVGGAGSSGLDGDSSDRVDSEYCYLVKMKYVAIPMKASAFRMRIPICHQEAPLQLGLAGNRLDQFFRRSIPTPIAGPMAALSRPTVAIFGESGRQVVSTLRIPSVMRGAVARPRKVPGSDQSVQIVLVQIVLVQIVLVQIVLVQIVLVRQIVLVQIVLVQIELVQIVLVQLVLVCQREREIDGGQDGEDIGLQDGAPGARTG
jgi:hypothetical protein